MFVGLFVKMGVSCAAFVGWKHRAQARVTRAYYRRLVCPQVQAASRQGKDDRTLRLFVQREARTCKAREKAIHHGMTV